MKKLSETYKELGIAFGYPIAINDAAGKETYREESDGYWSRQEYDLAGKQTYCERSDGFWRRREYDSTGNETYYEDSDGFWMRWEYDSNSNQTYFENSNGIKLGTPRAATDTTNESDD